jgi:DNA polymerase IV
VKRKGDYFSNSLRINKDPLVMYIDMNSYFASCEQQRHPELRGKPLGVLTYDSPNAAVIAASIEAKRMGVKTGMRLRDCRELCPQMLTICTHPAWYRQIHVDVMAILRTYCDDVIPKSIDEAVVNFHSYKWVYNDLTAIALQIKADIAAKYDYLKCSIGIAPNSFLAKVGTELQKPDGLVIITEDNIDELLATLRLTDLPGIAGANERRLKLIGIRTPVEMRHSSPALLRKAFGGVVGEYWHRRLNFGEVDMYNKVENRTMSATRTMSSQQSRDRQQLESMLISLCTRLEQRMVKGGFFCREVYFSIRYRDGTKWETAVKLADPVQDAMEMRSYIKERIAEFEKSRGLADIFTANTTNLTVVIQSFVKGQGMQYSLFDNRLKRDLLRKVVYEIKDMYEQKNIVRRGSELLSPHVMKDAIGFGSVRDMVPDEEGRVRNKHMLEEDAAPGEQKIIVIRQKPLPPPPKNEDDAYYEYQGPAYADVQFDNETIRQ